MEMDAMRENRVGMGCQYCLPVQLPAPGALCGGRWQGEHAALPGLQ